ncbi:MAG: hypothetical protein ACRC7N_11735, partial [Clostridium sp.]
MKKVKYYMLISLWLILSSLLMFYIHYKLFGQLENTIYYSLMSICIIPINILCVTIVFEKLMERQRRIERIGKINMLVGLFFSDVGYDLLKIFSEADKDLHKLKINHTNLKESKETLKNHPHNIVWENINFHTLQTTVIESHDILSKLLCNENILEHETFTDILMALMHLRDELILIKYRETSEYDICHIKGDATRVYVALTTQWIEYLEHLRINYPYMYNGAVKISPFN